jgi:hypothetical protein
MAGLWERIRVDAADRVSNHLLAAALVMHQTSGFSDAQILAAVNTSVQTPLTAAEQDDLAALAAVLDTQGSVTNRLVWLAKCEAWCLAAEHGVVTEAQWRAALGV